MMQSKLKSNWSKLLLDWELPYKTINMEPCKRTEAVVIHIKANRHTKDWFRTWTGRGHERTQPHITRHLSGILGSSLITLRKEKKEHLAHNNSGKCWHCRRTAYIHMCHNLKIRLKNRMIKWSLLCSNTGTYMHQDLSTLDKRLTSLDMILIAQI